MGHTKGLRHSYDVLYRVLKLVDDALFSATSVKNKTYKVDKKFETAIKILSKYETTYHPKSPMSDGRRARTVRERMEEATTKEKSISAILKILKEKLKVRVAYSALLRLHSNSQPAPDGWSKPQLTVVEFLLCKSLPYDNPTVVKRERQLELVKAALSF